MIIISQIQLTSSVFSWRSICWWLVISSDKRTVRLISFSSLITWLLDCDAFEEKNQRLWTDQNVAYCVLLTSSCISFFTIGYKVTLQNLIYCEAQKIGNKTVWKLNCLFPTHQIALCFFEHSRDSLPAKMFYPSDSRKVPRGFGRQGAKERGKCLSVW